MHIHADTLGPKSEICFNKICVCSPFLHAKMREILSDCALPISVLIFTYVGAYIFSDIDCEWCCSVDTRKYQLLYSTIDFFFCSWLISVISLLLLPQLYRKWLLFPTSVSFVTRTWAFSNVPLFLLRKRVNCSHKFKRKKKTNFLNSKKCYFPEHFQIFFPEHFQNSRNSQ